MNQKAEIDWSNESTKMREMITQGQSKVSYLQKLVGYDKQELCPRSSIVLQKKIL